MTEVDPMKRPSAKELLKELGEEVRMEWLRGGEEWQSGQQRSSLMLRYRVQIIWEKSAHKR